MEALEWDEEEVITRNRRWPAGFALDRVAARPRIRVMGVHSAATQRLLAAFARSKSLPEQRRATREPPYVYGDDNVDQKAPTREVPRPTGTSSDMLRGAREQASHCEVAVMPDACIDEADHELGGHEEEWSTEALAGDIVALARKLDKASLEHDRLEQERLELESLQERFEQARFEQERVEQERFDQESLEASEESYGQDTSPMARDDEESSQEISAERIEISDSDIEVVDDEVPPEPLALADLLHTDVMPQAKDVLRPLGEAYASAPGPAADIIQAPRVQLVAPPPVHEPPAHTFTAQSRDYDDVECDEDESCDVVDDPSVELVEDLPSGVIDMVVAPRPAPAPRLSSPLRLPDSWAELTSPYRDRAPVFPPSFPRALPPPRFDSQPVSTLPMERHVWPGETFAQGTLRDGDSLRPVEYDHGRPARYQRSSSWGRSLAAIALVAIFAVGSFAAADRSMPRIDRMVARAQALLEAPLVARKMGAVKPKLPAMRQGVALTSKQRDVRVSVDGVFRGTLPVTLDDLAPGGHELSFEATRYRTMTRTVQVERGEIAKLEPLQLELLKGRLHIELETVGARVMLGDKGKHFGREVIQGPFPRTIEVDPGEYELVAVRAGHIPVSLPVRIADEQPEQTVKVELNYAPPPTDFDEVYDDSDIYEY